MSGRESLRFLEVVSGMGNVLLDQIRDVPHGARECNCGSL
jgi:hypothetical protein